MFGDITVAAVGPAVRGTAGGSEEVLSAPHHRARVVDLRDLGDSQRPEWGFNQHHNVEGCQRGNLFGGLGLRQHHGGVISGLDCLDIQNMVGCSNRVDTDYRPGRVEWGIDKCLARGFPVLGRDAVFQIQDNDISCGGGFSESLGPVGRAEQPAWTFAAQADSPSACGSHQSSAAGRKRIMVFLDAVATTSPC